MLACLTNSDFCFFAFLLRCNIIFLQGKTGCAHQSPSCFLGPCHPGKSSPASQPGGPQSKDPDMRPPPGQTGCPEPLPARDDMRHISVASLRRKSLNPLQNKIDRHAF